MTRDTFLGRAIGRYRVVYPIAVGGMGAVYLGRTRGAAGFTKPVVIKRIRQDSVSGSEQIDLFVREAKIMAELRHPNIVSILDFLALDDEYVMVLEFVRGYDVRRWQRYLRRQGQAVPVDAAVYMTVEILEALQYVHGLRGPDGAALEIVHRDVNPANVLLDGEGNVWLSDFGVARMSDGSGQQTSAGFVKGKLPYVAPELYRGAPASAGSDVYAAALMLHVLLSGQNEFKAGEMAATVTRVLEHCPSRLAPQRADVGAALDAVLQRALAKSPAERFADAAALRSAILAAHPIDPTQVRMALAKRLHREYQDPRIAEHPEVPTIAHLERMWRMPTADLPQSVVPSDGADGEERTLLAASTPTWPGIEADATSGPVLHTTSGRPSRDLASSARQDALVHTTAERPRHHGVKAVASSRSQGAAAARRRYWKLAVAVASLSLLTVLALPYWQSAEAPPVLVVRPYAGAEIEASKPPAADAGLPSADAAPPATETPPKPSPKKRPKGPCDGPKPRLGVSECLTRSFRRRDRAITRCLRAAESTLDGASSIELRIRIDRRGRVRASEVMTPRFAGQPVARCLEAVAKKTRFPALGPATFRIPISVRRVKRPAP